MLTALGVLGFAPAIATASASPPAGHANTRDQEWWLAGLHVTQAWRQSEGSGITVAVLGTGVDADYPGLAGSVITGPDYTGSGRAPGSPYWGVEGTAVAGLIAARGHDWGLIGVAPAARILSVRVTLEFNDPLAFDQAIARRLPDAIAAGIRYATDHGARVIDLPLDPGTLGLTSTGDPAAAGGSPAERSAIAYALSRGVVLVAPSGDDGQGSGIVNYPAAYPGVIAVGAIDRTGQLASFSSRRSYASLTAPGVSLVAATPPDGFDTISSTSAASGIVAGVAALILSRFPHLTVAQVTQALLESTVTTAVGTSPPTLPARSPGGAGYGTVDATRALNIAALIIAANQPRRPAPVASSPKPARQPVTAARRPAASTLAGSVLRDAVAAVCVLIVLLAVALLVVRYRRNRRGSRGVVPPRQSGHGRTADRARTRGQHESRRPAAATDVTTAAADAEAPRWPRPPASPSWASPAGWQGGGIGEVRPVPDISSRPVVAPVPKSSSGYRVSRGAGRAGRDPGPPWAPAPEPTRQIGPLPVASAGPPPLEPGRGIRVPGDMAASPGTRSDPSLPVSFDLTTPPADFDLSMPAFGLTRPVFDAGPPASDAAPRASDAAPPASEDAAPPASEDAAPPASDDAAPPAEALPARQSLDFAAAPVPADYAVPPAGPGPETSVAADPSYIWDLAATDVFPATAGSTAPQDEPPEADQS